MEIIYQYSFLVSLLALSGWFFIRHASSLSSLMRMLFFAALASYFYSVVMAEATVDYKLSILFRDLLIISGLSAGFSLLRKNRIAFVLLLLGSLVVYQLYFKEVLSQSFPQNSTESQAVDSSNLDQNGELLLELKPGTTTADLSPVVQRFDLSLRPAFHPQDGAITDLDDYWLVDIPNKFSRKREEITSALKEAAATEHVEENETVLVQPISSTPLRKKRNKYDLNDPEIEKQWAFDPLKVDRFYDLLRSKKVVPKRSARLFILDTGVDGKHEDLAANYQSRKAAYDRDRAGHGTHCAGIAGAVSNNGIGVASLAMDNRFVRLTSVKVLSDFGGGTQEGIIDGMIEAADAGADVISMSLGGPSNDKKQKAYNEAVAYAQKKGAIVVVAAGNSNADAADYAPANARGAITVSAVDETLNKAAFSNFVQNVDQGLAAPGVNIYSSVPNNKYTSYNGTSMATPYVAGLIAVLKSIQPDLSTKKAYEILSKTGRKTKDPQQTGPFIQPEKALLKLMK